MKQQRSVLGRGLSALISSPVPVFAPTQEAKNTDSIQTVSLAVGDPAAVDVISRTPSQNSISYVALDLIVNNPSQPRQDFIEAELNELAESIKALGVLQPILVRPGKGAQLGKFEIIAGERRWRAAKRAGLLQVPAIVQDFADKEALEIALVENVQRSNLNPVEEASAYARLIEEYGFEQAELAQRLGKDRASISNYLRLLKLPTQVLEMLREKKISVGHAKAILSVKEPAAQLSLAKKILNEGLSVRALEAIVSRVVVLDSGKASQSRSQSGESSDTASNFPEVVDRMRTALGTKVSIKHHDSGRGRIEIEYFSEQELDRLVERICS